LKKKIIPFLLLILTGLLYRLYFEFKDIFSGSWILGGSSGLDFEMLIPAYLIFLFIAILLTISMIIKYGFKEMKKILIIGWIIIFLFTICDIGKDTYDNFDNAYANIKIERLRNSYKKTTQDFQFQEVIWLSNKRTVYVYTKDSPIADKDMQDIIKTIKVVDNLEIEIQLINIKQKEQLLYLYTNDKKFIEIDHDLMLENMAQSYFLGLEKM